MRDPAASVAAIRARGLRVSAARRLVVEALCAADRPVSAAEIAAGLGGRVPRSDLGSVYRNLETLSGVGLVRRFRVAHGSGLYALADSEPRDYAVCEWCGTLRVLEGVGAERVHAAIREACGYSARFSDFPLTGLCPSCASRAGSPASAAAA
jgi:Fe2+ or Zn2+ uptake regulation protein